MIEASLASFFSQAATLASKSIGSRLREIWWFVVVVVVVVVVAVVVGQERVESSSCCRGLIEWIEWWY